MDTDKILDRITEVKKMRLGDVAHNPSNWRTHGTEQKDAITAVLQKVGWAGVPLAYHSERTGTLTWIDGHARKEVAPDLVARVAILDINDAEADELLRTYDPLGMMAGADQDLLTELLEKADSSNEALAALYQMIANTHGIDIDIIPIEPFDFPEYDESIADDMETHEIICPECGHSWQE